jgi:membrane peptidoglycan carboxypeptidase
MSSYDDRSPTRGRAQVPGSAGRSDGAGNDAPVSPAVAGRARVGRAQVPRSATTNGPERPAGRASVGAGRVGVGSAVGAAAVGATAGAAPAAGRASVGRATVRPVSPGGSGYGSPGGFGYGSPGGPGYGEPARRGGPTRRPARGDAAKAKRRRRSNLVLASVAVLIMVAGLGLLGVTWFYDDVKPPTEFGEPETTSILFSNGKELAKLGKQNRSIVPADRISPVVKHAILAAEDKGFYEHGGVDVKGIARAAWNNFTGGTTQGASTITQQYARHAADLSGITYARKIREAVMASKLEQQYDKETILGYYLNAVYFGRGAHGIEAAAQTYFKKSALTPPGQKDALTAAEAAVLASVIKQPEPDAATGHKGFDPQINLQAAQDRWNYTLNNMAQKGWLTPQERAAAKYPTKTLTKWDPKKSCAVDCGLNTPAGNVVNYVRTELEAMGIKDWQKGGYRITTTIDRNAQTAAEAAARKTDPKSPMNKLSKSYMAALVSIDPTDGRVLAYYGGDNATGTDFAGLNTDPKSGKVYGGHPPGSSFKIYTLSAALRAGVSMQSRWDATLNRDPDSGFPISNAQRTPSCGKSCTLEQSTIKSYNVPFYWIAKGLGPAKVVEAARDAGVRTMWTDGDEVVDLTRTSPEEAAPSKFHNQVGYGQYKITVLDHANGMATIANRGVYNKAHFVQKVEQRDATGKWVQVNGAQLKPKQAFVQEQMDDLNGVLQKIPGSIEHRLADGRPATGKTGTWQFRTSTRDNAHAWMVGATPQMATAVWVGNAGKEAPIRDADGDPIGGSMTPGQIWEQYMDDAHEKLDLDKKNFPEPKDVGDPNHELATGETPPPQPPPGPQKKCTNPLQLFCPPDGGGDGDNGGGRGGGGGGGILPTRPPYDEQRW